MKIVKIFGGLGNQMFQYAFSMKLQQMGFNVFHDISWFNGNYYHSNIIIDHIFQLSFNLPPKKFYSLLRLSPKSVRGKALKKILNITGIYASDENYPQPEKIKNHSWKVFEGYWQDLNFIPSKIQDLRRIFTFREDLFTEQDLKLKQKIETSDSISLHVRRDDYLSNENQLLFGNICTEDYYKAAVAMLQGKIKNPVFYIFSDDTDWCHKHLSFINNACIVNEYDSIESFKDMWLMTYCKHNIIANSSFSWWGACLNHHPESIVIAPGRWKNFNDRTNIIPKGWIRI